MWGMVNELPLLVIISCACFADKYAEFDLNDQGEIGE